MSEYRNIANTFGVGKTTVWRCFKQFIHACGEKLIPDHIKWPTHEEFRRNATEFEMRWNYPMAVGAIDGSHIKIQVPKEEKTAYINYNNSYSMTLMAICNANYEFFSCFCGMTGRNHDSKVFKSSNAYATLSAPDALPLSTRVINGVLIPYHVLGDAAFGQNTSLIVPYRQRDSAPHTEKTFNSRHSRYVCHNFHNILTLIPTQRTTDY